MALMDCKCRMWTKKHLPKTHNGLVGNPGARSRIVEFLRTWPKTPKRALLVYGPTGIGKTASIHLIAAELGLELVELNASDFLSKSEIESVLGQASMQASLFGGGKVIVVDEVDCVSGTVDRGGIAALTEVIRKSRHPVILTANGLWENKNIRPLHSCCELVEFRKPDARGIAAFLSDICKKEGVAAGPGVVETIASRCGRDVRAALHDLRSVSEGRRGSLAIGDLGVLGNRDSEKNIFDTLQIIFKTNSCDIARQATWSSDKPYDELLRWIEANITTEYGSSVEETASAYEALSRSDVFQGRIMRRQNWGLLSYSNDMMSCGVALSKKGKRPGYTRYCPPAWAHRLSAAAKALASKIGAHCHVSARSALREYGFLLSELSSNDVLDEKLIGGLGLEEEEAEVIGGKKKRSRRKRDDKAEAS